MSTVLDAVGPAVARASWQAAALALLVVLLLWLLGERITPRWRYLLWSVVLIRLLCVATQASSWSAFNLVRWNEASARRIEHGPDRESTQDPRAIDRDARRAGDEIVTRIPSAREIESTAVPP